MFESDSTGIRDPDTKRGTSSRGASFRVVRDTGIEPVTSSVSGKRSPAELIAPKKSPVERMTGFEPATLTLAR